MSLSQEEFENAPKEKEVITQDDVGSIEEIFGSDLLGNKESKN